MRAQFVRGEDPKKSLQIGDAATYKKIADLMKNDGWTPEDPYQSDSAIGWAVEYGNLEMAKFLLDRHGIPKDDQDALVSWAVQANFMEMVKLLLSYNPDPNKLRYSLRMAVGNDPIWEVINYYIEENKVHESLDFKRDQEPKKAMRIGKNREIHKGDRFFIRNYFNSEMEEVTALSDESTEWGADGQPEQEIEVQFDDNARALAYKDKEGTWILGE
jgi:ankyrin repeat protein